MREEESQQSHPTLLESKLTEFKVDWNLAGKAPSTVKEYERLLRLLLRQYAAPTLDQTKQWIAESPQPSVRRMKGRAIRAFGSWLTSKGDSSLVWWQQVPLTKELEGKQPTVTAEDYLAIAELPLPLVVRVIVETLWATGMRRSELARVHLDDLNLDEGFIRIPKSKTDVPRSAPLTVEAEAVVRAHLQNHRGPLLIGRSSESIRKTLKRHNLPPAHAFRRGWAAHSLREGVHQTSVQSAGGWASGAMVARYTKALANEVAIDDFRKKRPHALRHRPSRVKRPTRKARRPTHRSS